MASSRKSMATTSATITIDLDLSDDNDHVRTDQLIQSDRYNALRDEVARDLENVAARERTSDYPAGSSLVYFIDGTRGAGKSTFLRSVYDGLPEDLRNQRLKIAPLTHIDPSRVESNEIVLLYVLKALKREVDRNARNNFTVDEDRHLAGFREGFRKLAGGLSLLSPSHNPLQDVDAELFLDWGLERAGHSADLRADLHRVIDAACRLLNVDALMLAFDDADTNAEHAKSVLECIRKYLDTPKLIILVTGDLELYSLQVRDMFSATLQQHSKHKDLDEQRVSQRIRMLDHLEDQYLLKLFPIRRRIQLRPLWNLMSYGQMQFERAVQYKLVSHYWEGPRDLDSVIVEIVRRSLRIRDFHDIALYREFLLKQPLRSVLQLLSRTAIHLGSVDSESRHLIDWSPELSDAVSDGLRSVALGSLYKFGVDVDAIAARELPALIEAVFDLALREGDVDTAAYLRPQPSDLGLRNSFASLSSDVATFCARRPDAIIQYMLAGPGSVALYGQVAHRQDQESIKEHDRRKAFKQYVGIGRKEDSLNWARHAAVVFTSPFLPASRFPAVSFGVIGLNKRKPKNVPPNVANKYETVSRRLIEIKQRRGPQPVFSLSLIDISGVSNRTLASVYNILGIIERLLSLQGNDLTPKNVMGILAKPYPSLSVSRPEWEDEQFATSDDEEGDQGEQWDEVDIELDSARHEALTQLSERTFGWLTDIQELKGSITPSSIFIGKIWTRLYFSLEKVSADRRGKIGAASLMELFALCVVNAFMVEELDHHLHVGMESDDEMRSIDRTNPLTSPETFVAKLRHRAVNRKQTPLTALIATCPLILGLLSANRDYAAGIVKLKISEVRSVNRNARKSLMASLEEQIHVEAYSDLQGMLCDKQTFDLIDHVYISGWSLKA